MRIERPISFAEEKDVGNKGCSESGDGRRKGNDRIPNGLGKEIAHILQQWKQDVHDQKINGGNVQILERVVGGCKRQMAILTEDGMMQLQQCGDQAGREKGGKKWQVFLKEVWGPIHEQITERECEKWEAILARMLEIN